MNTDIEDDAKILLKLFIIAFKSQGVTVVIKEFSDSNVNFHIPKEVPEEIVKKTIIEVYQVYEAYKLGEITLELEDMDTDPENFTKYFH